MNALKHGLRAKQLLLDDEDPVAFDQLRARLHDELRPVGALEEALVDQILFGIWRSDRARSIEVELLELHREHDRPGRGLALSLTRDAVHGAVFSVLLRYQGSLDRWVRRAVHELERRQARHRGEEVPVPGVVGVDAEVEAQGLGSFGSNGGP
jgi:hypothetical protein